MSKEEASTSLKRSLSAENETTCSLQDLIDCEKEVNEKVSAVLGASDATNCSYDQGYVYRQALYCCITCTKANKSENSSDSSSIFHGVCLACSYECHQNHELYELYTKRNFRCDCGNEKFSESKLACKLRPNKEKFNSLNKYNHNFDGLYCVCNKPYPDNSDLSNNNDSANQDEVDYAEDETSMIQCSVCEDWFHMEHLIGNELLPTSEEDYDEMICHGCMKKNSFLWYYQGYHALKAKKEQDDLEVDVATSGSNEDASSGSECLLSKLKSKNNQELDVAHKSQACCFLADWRNSLCKCVSCLSMYKEKEVEFLINKNDTIKYYEDCGRIKEAEQQNIDENKLLNDQLSKLNRISQVEFLHNLNDFKEELKDFLGSFAQNGQVVKSENISQFFEKLNERKKRKLAQDSQNAAYYCK